MHLTSGDPDASPRQVEERYRLLGNRRLLLTITYLPLFDEGTVVDVRQLARIIRAIELGRPPQEVETSDCESAYNNLVQVHLPTLDLEDVIKYDADQKTVTVTREILHYAFLVAVGNVMFS